MEVMLAGMLDVNTLHDRKVNINVLSVLEFHVPDLWRCRYLV